MKKSVISTLVSIALLISGNYIVLSQASIPAPSQKDLERIAKVKKDLNKIGVGKTITVSRVDNRDFFGRVKSIGENDFEIVETDSKQIQIFNYLDIKNVRAGDGNNRYVGGQRKNPRSKWFVFGGSVAAILIIAVVVATQAK
jgi:hypothetical protein